MAESGLSKAIAGIRSFAANAKWAARVFAQAAGVSKKAEGAFSSSASNMQAAAGHVSSAASKIAASAANVKQLATSTSSTISNDVSMNFGRPGPDQASKANELGSIIGG